MFVKDEFLSKLRRKFRLNLYEVKIWIALLSRGVSSAGELSDIGDVPRSRSYDILESLEKKGFVMQKIGKPIKYIAVPPSDIVERVKKNVRADTEERIKTLDALKDSPLIKELEVIYKQGINLVDPSELTGCLRGRQNFYSHLDLLIREAKKEVNIMTTTNDFIRKATKLKASLEKAKKRGVKIRIAAPLTKETKNLVESLKNFAEIRHVNTIKTRFAVIDKTNLVFATTDDKEVHPTFDLGIWVKTPFFASSMNDFFHNHWKTFKTPEKVL